MLMPAYRLLELWPDGMLLFTLTRGADGLAIVKSGGKINQLAVVEMVLEFIKLTTGILKAIPLPTKVRYWTGLYRMKQDRGRLPVAVNRR